ncbi:MAG: LegC family aminotransferase [Candidatus Scalindua sp.]|nr:LegC family aminotransferase [Candidatus Scalindua sp.]MBT6226361.1 LegC family aminotransferase [Candidatus Scalindua sp.]
MIPLSTPVISGNEWKYIKDCLDKGWVSSVGSYVNQFEEVVADYVGCKYGIAVVNGTAALHLSLVACDVRRGDEVIVPSLTFVATANVVKYCGAEPVFVDCDDETLCLNVEKLRIFLRMECEQKDNGYTYNKISGRRVKAIIPVHIFGHPVEMDALLEICQLYNIDIIEDATESLGSEYKGRKTGSFGKLACFSFNGNKMITTGGGGMVVTNDGGLAERIKHLSTQAKNDSVEYDHDEVGYNYRLTNIQAAMGVAQMECLDKFVEIKRKNAFGYQNLISSIDGIEFLWEKPWVKSNFWFYTVKVSNGHKKSLMDYLISKNIQVRPIWKPIHTLPMYEYCQAYKIENTINIYETAFNLPCSVSLKEDEILFVVKNINEYFTRLHT